MELHELQHSHKDGTLALRKVAQLCNRPWKLLDELTLVGATSDRKVAVTLATLVCDAISDIETVELILRDLNKPGKSDLQPDHVVRVRTG